MIMNNLKRIKINTASVRCKHVWTKEKIVKSPYKDIVVPKMTMDDYIWRNMDKWPTKTAMVCGVTDRAYTYEQIYKDSRKFGATLRKKFGIKDGDKVAVILPNMPEYSVVTTGILAAGGVVTTVNPIYTKHEIKRQLEITDAKVVIAHPSIFTTVKEAVKLMHKDIPVICVDMTEALPEGSVSYKELLRDNYIDLSILREVKRNAEDVAAVLFSSGTTGLPKGVELTNFSSVANCEQQTTDVRTYDETTASHQDSSLIVLPMFHCYGLLVLMAQKLSAGLKLVTLPQFRPDHFLNALVDYKINLQYVAPPLVNNFIVIDDASVVDVDKRWLVINCDAESLIQVKSELKSEYDVPVHFLGRNPNVTSKHLEHLKVLVSGAAPCSLADVTKLLEKSQKNLKYLHGYGLTESGPLVSIATPDITDYQSVGCALPSEELRIVDTDMKSLGPDEAGELLVRGPNVCKGYSNDPEANKGLFTEDGWLRTGDMAKINEKGEITITDRLKEMIKVKGFQVSPAELEDTVKQHPSVFDAAVIGVPDDVTGEKPKAFVMLREGATANEDDIKEFVANQVAPFKKLKEVTFVQSIPKSAAGKILKKVMKEQYCKVSK